jgi:hypothetical protein
MKNMTSSKCRLIKGGPLDILGEGRVNFFSARIFFLSSKFCRNFFFGVEAVQEFFFERLYTYLFSLSTDREKMVAM